MPDDVQDEELEGQEPLWPGLAPVDPDQIDPPQPDNPAPVTTVDNNGKVRRLKATRDKPAPVQ